MLRIITPPLVKSIFKPVPLWVHLYVTRKCNLNCEYCFVRDHRKPELDLENLKRVVDKIHSLGCPIISFFGGEPTIKKGFVDLVDYTHRKGLITHMSTNGVLLDEDYINRLGHAGIDVINLSVDSVYEFEASTKSYTQRREILDKLISARKRFGFDINVNLVLTHQNYTSAVETVKRISGLNIPISVGLIINNTLNDNKQDQDLFFTTDEQKAELLKTIDEMILLKKQGYNIIEPTQYFKDIEKFIAGNLDWYCSAGEYYFSVDSDGKFQYCAGLPSEDFSIFDIGPDYFEKLAPKRKKLLDHCTKVCMSNCLYDTSYFIKHPLYFIREML